MRNVPHRDVKKGMTSGANYGLRLLLQFLCFIMSYYENATQIWCAISNCTVSAYVETKLVLMQQEELLVLAHLLSLLGIYLSTQLVHLALIDMIIPTCCNLSKLRPV